MALVSAMLGLDPDLPARTLGVRLPDGIRLLGR
jgi:hypothetical protein